MIWGKPKLGIHFVENGNFLDCLIQNVPRKGFLKHIGVETEIIQDFSVNIVIEDKNIEDEIERVVYYGSRAMQFGEDYLTYKKQIILPASDRLCARVNIVTATPEGAHIIDANFDPNKLSRVYVDTELKVGTYQFTIKTFANGKITETIKNFEYRSSEPYLVWKNNDSSRGKR